jgi:hypothetical protein
MNGKRAERVDLGKERHLAGTVPAREGYGGEAMRSSNTWRIHCLECAQTNTPHQLSVNFFDAQSMKECERLAYTDFRNCEIFVPRPDNPETLHVYLHECGHFTLHARRKGPLIAREIEADRWAIARTRKAKIPVAAAALRRLEALEEEDQSAGWGFISLRLRQERRRVRWDLMTVRVIDEVTAVRTTLNEAREQIRLVWGEESPSIIEQHINGGTEFGIPNSVFNVARKNLNQLKATAIFDGFVPV